MVAIDRTKTGKYPVTEEFRKWTDLIGQEAAQALGAISPDADTVVVIGGVQLEQGSTHWQVTPGVVALNGNIYTVGAYVTAELNSVPGAIVASTLYVTFTTNTLTINQASNGWNMQDGSNPNVVIQGTAAITTEVSSTPFPGISYLTNSPWHVVGATGEPPFLNGWVAPQANAPLRFKKTNLNQLIIEGAITTGASGTSAFALPAAFNPSGGRNFIVYSESSAGIAQVSVQASSGIYYVTITPLGTYTIGEAIYVNLPPIAMD